MERPEATVVEVPGARLRTWHRLGGRHREDDGIPVVLIHGGFCDHADWRYQMRGLDPSLEVIALDLRGHGRSTVTDASTCTVESFADDVLAVAAHLAARPALLVGHSLGCRVALAAARRAPGAVRGLVLVDGSRLGSPGVAGDAQAILREVERRGSAAVLHQLFSQMFVGRVDENVRREVLGRLPGLAPDVVRATMMSTITWDAHELDGALDTVTAPVLAVQSTYLAPQQPRRTLLTPDERTPWLELLASRLSPLESTNVTGVGHFCMLEAPGEVIGAIERFATL